MDERPLAVIQVTSVSLLTTEEQCRKQETNKLLLAIKQQKKHRCWLNVSSALKKNMQYSNTNLHRIALGYTKLEALRKKLSENASGKEMLMLEENEEVLSLKKRTIFLSECKEAMACVRRFFSEFEESIPQK